jgi:hypothetical protein
MGQVGRQEISLEALTMPTKMTVDEPNSGFKCCLTIGAFEYHETEPWPSKVTLLLPRAQKRLGSPAGNQLVKQKGLVCRSIPVAQEGTAEYDAHAVKMLAYPPAGVASFEHAGCNSQPTAEQSKPATPEYDDVPTIDGVTLG